MFEAHRFRYVFRQHCYHLPSDVDVLPSLFLLATLGGRAIALPDELRLNHTTQVNEMKELAMMGEWLMKQGAEAVRADISSQAEISARQKGALGVRVRSGGDLDSTVGVPARKLVIL